MANQPDALCKECGHTFNEHNISEDLACYKVFKQGGFCTCQHFVSPDSFRTCKTCGHDWSDHNPPDDSITHTSCQHTRSMERPQFLVDGTELREKDCYCAQFRSFRVAGDAP